MNTQDFLDNFAYIANSPSGYVALRELILQIAIRGFFVSRIVTFKTMTSLPTAPEPYKEHPEQIKRIKPLSPIQDHEKGFQIPNNWTWVRLGDVGDWGSGSTPDRQRSDYYDGSIPWFKSGELNDGILSKSQETVTELAIEECSLRFNNPGDVLIAMYGATIGKVAIQTISGTTNQAVCACTCYEELFNWWLFYVLRAYKNHFIELAAGGAQPNISRNKIINTVIPLPPLQEQKRIVAKIEELLALCDQLETKQNSQVELRQKTNQSLLSGLIRAKTTDDLKASWNKYSINIPSLLCTEDGVKSLKEAIITLGVIGKLEDFITNGDSQKIIDESLAYKKMLLVAKEITHQKRMPTLTRDELLYNYPSHWAVSRFEDLGYVTGGVTKGKRSKGKTTASYPYLRVANVQRGYFLLDDVQEIEIPEDEFEKYVLHDEDILIAEGGDWDKVGRTATWRNQVQDCLHQNHVFKARLFSDRVEKKWIELVFNSSIGRQYWSSASKQTTNLASINMTQVRSFPVPIPPQEEQQRILAKLDSLLTLCDELIEKIRKSRRIQAGFSKATIYTILYDKRTSNITITDEFQTKLYDRHIAIKINLVTPMHNDLTNTLLAKILEEHGGQMDAKELWKASKLKEIDDFYALLKQEIEAGFIQEPGAAEIRLVEIEE